MIYFRLAMLLILPGLFSQPVLARPIGDMSGVKKGRNERALYGRKLGSDDHYRAPKGDGAFRSSRRTVVRETSAFTRGALLRGQPYVKGYVRRNAGKWGRGLARAMR